MDNTGELKGKEKEEATQELLKYLRKNRWEEEDDIKEAWKIEDEYYKKGGE